MHSIQEDTMRRIFVILSILCMCGSHKSFAQPPLKDPRVASAFELLDLWLDAQYDYEQIPGISAGVVYDQELIWSKGYGFSDLNLKNNATPQTIYSICSISKLFTSVALMQLYDEGKVRLDDPITKHIPWFDLEQQFPESPPITIQGLLTHSSGLPREAGFPYWSGPDFPFPERKAMIDKLSDQKMLYPAETYYQYSNLGLSLLGEIAAEVAGKSFDKLIHRCILDPLGMSDTRTKLPEKLHKGQLATGYSAMTREGVRNELPLFQARGIAPAAGFSSTVEDLARFASWQFRLLEKGGQEILQANTLKKMHRVHWVDEDWSGKRGLGFSVWRDHDKTFVGHGGSCPGYRTQLQLHTPSKIAVIFMANASGVSTGIYTNGMFDIVYDALKAAADEKEQPEPYDTRLNKYKGIYSSAPWGGETAVIVWEGQLAMVGFPTESPKDRIMKYKHVEGDMFRRIRSDGELGESVVFEVDENGDVVRMWRNNNYSPKVR